MMNISCPHPSRVIHNHYIIFLLIFNFKNKYDEYNRLLKWLIHFCYNLWLLTY